MTAPVATTVTPAARAALAGLGAPSRSRGWCAAAAGILEASAPKPGNVHPAAAFSDLTYDDLVAAAIAIAAPIDRAATRPVGQTILDAVEEARRAADTNANLGIILLTAPLAAVPDDTPLEAGAVDRVLAGLDADDAALVYRAIARGRPGGMGQAVEWDLAGPPPPNLRSAMATAADRDQIARLWAEGFTQLFTGPVADLATALDAGLPLADAIVSCFLHQLAREPDSLIARRHGVPTARDVRDRAAGIVALAGGPRPADLAAFDAALRSPRRVNPGTTADLVAAALYILLRTGRLPPPSCLLPPSPQAPP